MDLKHISVPVLAGAVVIAALLRRASVAVGHWLTIAIVGYYLAVNFRFFAGNIRRFGRASAKTKVKLIVYIAFVCVALNGIFTMSVSYFALIVLFAVDYLLNEK